MISSDPKRAARARSAVAAVGLAAVLASALALCVSCSTGSDDRPNIVVVVLDTVRDDVAGLEDEGGGGPMPALEALGRESTVFTNAWSTSPWTLPSHASLLTGLLPSGHGCTGRSPALSEKHRTFAEHLVGEGYEAAAFFSNPWLTDRMSGMMRGFDSRYVESRGDERIHHMRGSQGGLASNADIAEWLDARDRDRPFLMFVNYMEAHLPYDPAPEVRSTDMADMSPDDVVTTVWAYEFNAGLHPAEDVDWERIRRLYSGDASTADALLAELLRMLDDHDLYDDAVVIVASDHGENLGEHGLMDHQFGLFETLLAVPLVVRAPGSLPPGVRDDPVMLTDVFPSVLELAGLPVPRELPHARSLLGPSASPDRPVIAEYAGANPALVNSMRTLNPDLDTAPMRTAYATVRAGNLRLTVGSDGSHMLEDFATDPDEMVDLQLEGRSIAAGMQELLPTVGPPAVEIKVDDGIREELRSLGYLP